MVVLFNWFVTQFIKFGLRYWGRQMSHYVVIELAVDYIFLFILSLMFPRLLLQLSWNSTETASQVYITQWFLWYELLLQLPETLRTQPAPFTLLSGFLYKCYNPLETLRRQPANFTLLDGSFLTCCSYNSRETLRRQPTTFTLLDGFLDACYNSPETLRTNSAKSTSPSGS